MFDFAKGDTLVSLKTVDTTGSSWLPRMQDVIRQIAESEAEGGTANLVLDLRVQPGEAASAQSLVEFGRQYNVSVIIKEF